MHFVTQYNVTMINWYVMLTCNTVQSICNMMQNIKLSKEWTHNWVRFLMSCLVKRWDFCSRCSLLCPVLVFSQVILDLEYCTFNVKRGNTVRTAGLDKKITLSGQVPTNQLRSIDQ